MPWSNFDDLEGGGALRKPFFCYFVTLISIIWYMVIIGMNGWTFALFSINPTVGPSAEILAAAGAKYSYKIVESK